MTASAKGDEGPDETNAPRPLCVLNLEKMPESWQPHEKIHASLSQKPWTTAETEEAAGAVRGGLAELTEFFEAHPKAALELGQNTVECFISIRDRRRRVPEPPEPGTYGGAFRKLTKSPAPPAHDASPCGE